MAAFSLGSALAILAPAPAWATHTGTCSDGVSLSEADCTAAGAAWTADPDPPTQVVIGDEAATAGVLAVVPFTAGMGAGIALLWTLRGTRAAA